MNIFHKIAAILLFSVLLTERFIYTLPDWLAIIICITAALMYGTGIYKDMKTRHQTKV